MYSLDIKKKKNKQNMLPGGTDPVGNQQNAPPGHMGILGALPTSEVKIDSGWSGNGLYRYTPKWI